MHNMCIRFNESFLDLFYRRTLARAREFNARKFTCAPTFVPDEKLLSLVLKIGANSIASEKVHLLKSGRIVYPPWNA